MAKLKLRVLNKEKVDHPEEFIVLSSLTRVGGPEDRYTKINLKGSFESFALSCNMGQWELYTQGKTCLRKKEVTLLLAKDTSIIEKGDVISVADVRGRLHDLFEVVDA